MQRTPRRFGPVKRIILLLLPLYMLSPAEAADQVFSSHIEAQLYFTELTRQQQYPLALEIALLQAKNHEYSDSIRAEFYGLAARICIVLEDEDCYSSHIADSIQTDEKLGHFYSAFTIHEAADKEISSSSLSWLIDNHGHGVSLLTRYVIRGHLKFYDDRKDIEGKYDLLQRLYKSGYQGGYANEAFSPDFLWVELIRLTLQRGETDEASQLLDEITVGSALQPTLWHNRAFSPLWSKLENEERFSKDGLIEADFQLAKSLEEKASHYSGNTWLTGRRDYIRALIASGEPGAAIELAILINENLSSDNRKGQPYFYFMQSLAEAYLVDDRDDEAFKVMESLAAKFPDHADAINQVLNYSNMLGVRGHYEKALELTDLVLMYSSRQVSINRELEAKAVRVCSMHFLGRSDEARALYLEMLPIAFESYSPVVSASICVGDVESAVRLFQEALDHESYRIYALKKLSNCGIDNKLVEQRLTRQTLAHIVALPEIQKAVDAVGRLGNCSLN